MAISSVPFSARIDGLKAQESYPQFPAKDVILHSRKILSAFTRSFLHELPTAASCAKKIGIGSAVHIILSWHVGEPLLNFVREHMNCKFINVKNPPFWFFFGRLLALDDWKVTVIGAPIAEELFDRYLIQHLLLKQLPQFACKKLGLKKCASFFDLRIATIIRITVASMNFGVGHVKDLKGMNIGSRVCDAFLWGLIWGGLFESQGYLASTAAHFTQNAFALTMSSWYLKNRHCFPVQSLPWWFARSFSIVDLS
jgi:hypothetical protein